MQFALLKRFIAAGLGAAGVVNGALMLSNGALWHGMLSAMAPMGSYHAHLVADSGAALLAAGAGLIVRAWRPRFWPVAIAGLGFVLLHGALHMLGFSGGHAHDAAAGFGLLLIPTALALWAALPARNEASGA